MNEPSSFQKKSDASIRDVLCRMRRAYLAFFFLDVLAKGLAALPLSWGRLALTVAWLSGCVFLGIFVTVARRVLLYPWWKAIFLSVVVAFVPVVALLVILFVDRRILQVINQSVRLPTESQSLVDATTGRSIVWLGIMVTLLWALAIVMEAMTPTFAQMFRDFHSSLASLTIFFLDFPGTAPLLFGPICAVLIVKEFGPYRQGIHCRQQMN